MDIISNSPLRKVPTDYCPEGSARWFPIPDGLDQGKTMFYYDHQPDEPAHATVLFVHGNPECSYTYRHCRDALLTSGCPLRIVAVDHIGFGLSDQASFEMVDMHHSANLQQLISALDLQQVILVVHDWGGAIGVGAFAGQMDRVAGLVVANSTIFPMPSEGMTYSNGLIPWLPWRYFPYLVPNAQWGGLAAGILQDCRPGNNLGLLMRVLRMQLRFMFSSFDEGTPEYVFSESLRGRANAKSSKRNVLQTPYWGHGYDYEEPRLGRQDNRAYYQAMQQALPSAWGPQGRNIPVAGHFGKWYPCGKDEVIQQWLEALPRMQEDLHEYPGFSHFIEEDKGPEMAESIASMAAQLGA